MKRVLIITYYWPPSGGAGVQRWLKFVKYLRDFDWEPVVFIPSNPEYPEIDLSLQKDVPAGLEIIRCKILEPYNAYKKLLGQKKESRISAGFLSENKKNKTLEAISVWIRGNLFIPDARRFWIRPAVRMIAKYLSDHTIDAIASTGPPHSTHLIAEKIHRRFRVPWLADFRDPWTSIDFYGELKLTGWADRLHHALERKVLQQASAVTVISRSMAEDFGKLFPRNYEVITNGFDHTDIAGENIPFPDKRFSIAHIGTLGPARNPIVLWKALKDILSEDLNFKNFLEIKLVGKIDVSVNQSLAEYDLEQFVKRIPYMPHDEVIACQQQSRVLLLIINNSANAKMILTGKFYEYMAAGRPILCIGPEDGDAAGILAETKSGLLAGYNDTETMKKHVQHYFSLFLKNNLEVSPEGIMNYSRKTLTKRLSEVLNQISR